MKLSATNSYNAVVLFYLFSKMSLATLQKLLPLIFVVLVEFATAQNATSISNSTLQSNSSLQSNTTSKAPSLKRDLTKKYGYANFVKHENSYLSVKVAITKFVRQVGECGYVCATHPKGLSFNYAVKPNKHGLFACEVLETDKYNDTTKFLANKPDFLHYSIYVSISGKNNVIFILKTLYN